MSALGVFGKVVLGSGDEPDVINLNQMVESVLTLTDEAVAGLLNNLVDGELNFSDLASCTVVRSLSAENTLNFDDSGNRIITGDADDDFTLTDEALVTKFKFVFADDTFALSQDAAYNIVANRNLVSTLVFTQVAHVNTVRNLSASNTLNFDQDNSDTNSKTASNELTFTDEADEFIAKVARNVAEWTQLVDRTIVSNHHYYDLFEVYHTVTTGHNTFNRTMISYFSPTSIALGFAVKGASSVFTISGVASGYATKHAESIFSIVQTLSLNGVYNRANRPEQARFAMVQSVSLNIVKFVHAENVLALNQEVHKTKVINVEADNTLGFGDDLVRARYFEEITDTLDLSHSVFKSKVVLCPVSNELVFTQAVHVNTVLNLSASNELVFLAEHYQLANINDTIYITVPNAVGSLVKNYVVLTAGSTTIILPRPEFDDSEAFQGSLIIHRSRNATRRIYKKDTLKAKLSYSFIMPTAKANELQEFILANNSASFYLDNWKGERWFVTFDSNPFQFTDVGRWSPCGNKVSVTLEFEGVRLY